MLHVEPVGAARARALLVVQPHLFFGDVGGLLGRRHPAPAGSIETMADANCTNPRCDGAPAITVVQPAANIALSGARATRDARDASAFGALVSPYEKFESISLQQRVTCELGY